MCLLRIESRLGSDAASSGLRAVPPDASVWLLVELLEAILELGEIVDLILEHPHSVLLLWIIVLELSHLIHSTDDFLIGVLDSLRHFIRTVLDFDRCNISAIALIVLELDVVLQ